ncbi:MAG: hypothetical protein RIS94_2017 [Pseudomonadota bacterium]|jgi:hypothetical protein
MNFIASTLLAATALAMAPAAMAAPSAAPFDFHQFEAAYARTDALADGYARVQSALPDGLEATQAVAVLRQAGARCERLRQSSGELGCYYREQLSVDDYLRTYATWDVTLSLIDSKVGAVRVARTTDQHS